VTLSAVVSVFVPVFGGLLWGVVRSLGVFLALRSTSDEERLASYATPTRTGCRA